MGRRSHLGGTQTWTVQCLRLAPAIPRQQPWGQPQRSLKRRVSMDGTGGADQGYEGEALWGNAETNTWRGPQENS